MIRLESLRHFVVLITLLWTHSWAQATIYGEDNLIDLPDVQDARVRDFGRSVAVQIRKGAARPAEGDEVVLNGSAFRNKSICEGERFLDQPVNGTCTGFLIGPNLLMTAGHCVYNGETCRDYDWIFDYAQTELQSGPARSSLSKIYSCEKVVKFKYSTLDFSIIQLSRAVLDRRPLELDKRSQSLIHREVFTISSPRGLPLKMSTGFVRADSHPDYFVTNLDTMRGSSGAPVFDTQTGLVLGIVVRGDLDYSAHPTEICNQLRRCADHECRGEEATKVPGTFF